MPEIAFHANATEEMRAAAAYYEARERGLGDQFLDEVEEGSQRIRQFPRLWPIYEGEYRRYLLKRFPFGLIYRIDLEHIFIMAVAHLHRRPGYWRSRA
jgi:ParE toxin of type II toxin-antitoxin system, parDE